MSIDLHNILLLIQRTTSSIGILIISTGVVLAMLQYIYYIFSGQLSHQAAKINSIRLTLSRILLLGLEFIVAADLIGTTTTPDYYSLGLAAIIVAIRTLLSYSLNRELMSLTKEH